MNFQHCLRIAIAPDKNHVDRFKNIIDFCKERHLARSRTLLDGSAAEILQKRKL